MDFRLMQGGAVLMPDGPRILTEGGRQAALRGLLSAKRLELLTMGDHAGEGSRQVLQAHAMHSNFGWQLQPRLDYTAGPGRLVEVTPHIDVGEVLDHGSASVVQCFLAYDCEGEKSDAADGDRGGPQGDGSRGTRRLTSGT